jgi:deoxycytidylate deaminase
VAINTQLQIETKTITDEAVLLADKIFNGTSIRDLIEYSRAIHAEMDAIISVARTSGGMVVGSTLYTTTFPCHSCARHIVAAGINRVFYIEPYEKSLAKDLHSDSIEFDHDDENSGEKEIHVMQSSPVGQAKTRFVHFEGVAPRQYLNLFRMHSDRKTKELGKVINVHPVESQKSITEYLDDYRDFETKVVEHLKKVTGNTLKKSNS